MKRKDSSSNVITATFAGMRKIDDEAAAWVLKNRSISRETLERLGVGCGTEFFGEVKRQLPCIKFPYEDGGWKARSMVDDVKAFTSKSGMEVTFWGLREVLNGPLSTVYIVEGEFDRCALVEAGIEPNCVLAAPGAPGSRKRGPVEPPQYVKDALAEGLGKCKKFVLCTDQDDAGHALRAALAQVLGVAKVEFIDWSWETFGKDANDFLKIHGPAELLNCLKNGSKQWPAEGVFRMSEIAHPPRMEIWHPSFEGWHGKMALAPGTLSVVTGHPGHGKTQMWAQIWFQILLAYDQVACIATFETKPKPHYQKIIRQFHAQQRLYDTDGKLMMSSEQLKRADDWINDHYRFIIDREERPTLEWMLNQAEIVVVRDGVKILQVDPWNRLESRKEPKENESDYIGRCLRALYAFANDLKVHVQVLAHPSKMDGYRRGHLPELEDIAGSKHWENMVDQGFVVHRPRLYDDDGTMQRYAELHHKKARFEQLGHPTKFGLEYDIDVGRYGVCPLAKKPKKGETATSSAAAVKDAQKPRASDYDRDQEDVF